MLLSSFTFAMVNISMVPSVNIVVSVYRLLRISNNMGFIVYRRRNIPHSEEIAFKNIKFYKNIFYKSFVFS